MNLSRLWGKDQGGKILLLSSAGMICQHQIVNLSHYNTLSVIVLLSHMGKHTVSFRLDADKVTALDTLAEAQDRDRTYLLNEAVAAYLDVQKWQMEQIKKSLNQADAGALLPHSKVKRAVRSWRRG
jgi:predicted transcriptional regulator